MGQYLKRNYRNIWTLKGREIERWLIKRVEEERRMEGGYGRKGVGTERGREKTGTEKLFEDIMKIIKERYIQVEQKTPNRTNKKKTLKHVRSEKFCRSGRRGRVTESVGMYCGFST